MYAREKSSIRDEEMAEKCSADAIRLAPDCVIANVVRRLVVPSHHAPCLALCETTYGKGVLALLPLYVSPYLSSLDLHSLISTCINLSYFVAEQLGHWNFFFGSHHERVCN